MISLKRPNAINSLFWLLRWSLFVLALTVHRVDGEESEENDDEDYYSSSNNDNYDDYDDYDYAAEEEERIHEIIVDEWYDLVRYLVGLGLCIFTLIGLYFHQYASYHFLKKYTRPRETERRVGRVVSCEPLLSSTSIRDKRTRNENKKKRRKKKDNKHQGVAITTYGKVVAGDGRSITDYVREEDLECYREQEEMESNKEFTDYRMLVVYKVPRARSGDLFMCCGSADERNVISCTNSFSPATCASDIDDKDSAAEAIDAYRSRSLPQPESFNEFNQTISNNMGYMMQPRDECEYFQWFETNKPRHIDSDINLILLKGQPKSACTPELLESHLSEIGKSHEREEHRACKSLNVTGTALMLAVIVLILVCVFEIQAMPNPETQRPLGYWVLGGFTLGSTVCAYLFARLLFEQYKKKVFLSAFTVPTTPLRRRSSTASDFTDIVEKDMIPTAIAS